LRSASPTDNALGELRSAARVAETWAQSNTRDDDRPRGFGGSALTDTQIAVPEDRAGGGIPVTYVPARNTVFLSFALAWSEVLEAHDIFIGVNAVDYSVTRTAGPEFIAAFENMANLATRAGVGRRVAAQDPHAAHRYDQGRDHRRGTSLGVDFGLTVSCYQADAGGAGVRPLRIPAACGARLSCGGIADPTRYR